MKYVEWIEPYARDSGVPVICRMRVPHVLMAQIEKNPLYGSFSEKAIEDFIVTTWGRLIEYDA